MTLWVPIRVQPTARVAALLSAAMHVLVLVGLAQCTMRPHVDLNPKRQVMRPPIEVMILTEPMVAPKKVVAKAAPDPATHSAAVRQRQQIATQTAPQSKPPTLDRDIHIHAESRPADDVTQDLRMVVNPPDAPRIDTPPKLAASQAGQIQGDSHATPAIATSAERQSDQRPPQGAQPDYAYNPQPDYPILLREQGIGGVVWLRVWVDSDGSPVEIKLAKGSGYRLLDDAALRAVKLWRFIPAKHGDQRLASWVEFPIRFMLNG